MPPVAAVVIIGAGFAGTTLIRALERQWPGGFRLTLVSDESYTTFNPMLPEAVGASVFPEQVVVPVREMLRQGGGSRFIMGAVTSVDTADQSLVCRTLAGDLTVHYDHLVLALGNRARLDLLPGMAEHALPLKTVGDAMHIRNMVLRRLARIELETDAVLRHQLGHFIVIGGGFSGVEVAGELVDCLASIRRYYPLVRPDELKITVLHGTDRPVPELSPALGPAALASQRQPALAVHLLKRPPPLFGPRGAPRIRGSTARVGDRGGRIAIDGGLFFQAQDKYVRVVTAEDEAIIRMSLKELLGGLDPDVFWQVHRGVLVRVQAIDRVRKDELGRHQLSVKGRNDVLPVSGAFQQRFRGM